MKFLTLLVVLCIVEIAVVSTSFCGQYATQTSGDYVLENNLWGESGGSGAQCTSLTSTSGTDIAWSTSWYWSGGSGVKSFANAYLNVGLNKQISAITSIPTTWAWGYSYSGSIVGDVAYDIWTSSTSGGANQYEIMIWLANYNTQPVATSYTAAGVAVPITTVTIGGTSYKLYEGPVSSWLTYTYIAQSTITSFSADLKPFFTDLGNRGYVSSSQYITALQAGTEATTGGTSSSEAKFTTTKYTAVITV